jgi:hypothetical protein
MDVMSNSGIDQQHSDEITFEEEEAPSAVKGVMPMKARGTEGKKWS